MTTTHQDCRTLDAQDPLAPLRDHFSLPAGVIYLDGNSLGVAPKATAARVADVVTREWGADLIQSWNTASWFDLPQRLGNQLAPLIGAGPNEVQRQDWHQALAATVSRMEAGGATLVDLNETVLERFHEYRTHAPLDFKTPKGRAPLAQDVRLLITTAAVMDLVYAEYDDLYMEQLRSGTNVRVQAL